MCSIVYLNIVEFMCWYMLVIWMCCEISCVYSFRCEKWLFISSIFLFVVWVCLRCFSFFIDSGRWVIVLLWFI